MKTTATLVIFIVLFEVIEPRGLSGYREDVPYLNSERCPKVNMTFCNGISHNCINGVFTINGKGYKTIKSTDKVEITFNELHVNGKLIEKIPPASGSGNSSFVRNNLSSKGSSFSSSTNNKECPSVAKINCKNVFHSCVKGQLYINDEKVENVKSTDKVIIIENNLRINGEFIRHIPDFFADDDDDDDDYDDDEEDGEKDEDENEEDEEEKDEEDEDEEEADENDTDEVEEDEGEEEEANEDKEEENETDDDTEVEEEEESDDEEEEDEEEADENDTDEVDEDDEEDEEEADEDEKEENETDEDNEVEEEEESDDEEEDEEEADENDTDEVDEDDEEDEEEADEDEKEENETDEDNEVEEEEESDEEEDHEDHSMKNNNGEKSYDFSNMKITCRGCSGINFYWKNGKFFINDVEVKNFQRKDSLLITGNKVFVNNKFNCYI